MLTSIALVFSMLAPAPAAPADAGPFTFKLTSIKCENQASPVGADEPYGIVVVASVDPAKPGVLGHFTFFSNKLRRNEEFKFQPPRKTRSFMMPLKDRATIVHVMLCERDKEDVKAVTNAFLEAHNENIVRFSQERLTNNTLICQKIRLATREKLRKLGKWLKNDQDLIDYREFGFLSKEIGFAQTAGFEKGLTFLRTMPTISRYFLQFRLEKASG